MKKVCWFILTATSALASNCIASGDSSVSAIFGNIVDDFPRPSQPKGNKIYEGQMAQLLDVASCGASAHQSLQQYATHLERACTLGKTHGVYDSFKRPIEPDIVSRVREESNHEESSSRDIGRVLPINYDEFVERRVMQSMILFLTEDDSFLDQSKTYLQSNNPEMKKFGAHVLRSHNKQKCLELLQPTRESFDDLHRALTETTFPTNKFEAISMLGAWRKYLSNRQAAATREEKVDDFCSEHDEWLTTQIANLGATFTQRTQVFERLEKHATKELQTTD